MMTIRVLIIMCIVIGWMSWTPFSNQAAENNDNHAVLVLVPRFTMNNFFHLMEDKSLQSHSSVIAINRVTSGVTTPLSEIVTLSSGVPSEAVSSLEQPMSVQKMYTTGDEKLYQIALFDQLVDKNQQSTHKAKPGRLGEMLSSKGVFTSFIGHSAVNDNVPSFAPFFTVDENGETAGHHAMAVDKVDSSPGGYVMNVDKTMQWVKGVQDRYSSTWTVVEWGDFYRSGKSSFSESKNLLEPLKDLLFQLKKQKQPVYLLGVDPPEKRIEKGFQMIPFAKWDAEFPPSMNRFHSSTVNQSFLGSSLDVAPSILETFQVPKPSQWNGNSLRVDKTASLNQMKKEIAGAASIYSTRASVLSSYISILIVLLIVGFLFWKRSDNLNQMAPIWINSAVLVGMASPLSFLVASAMFGRADVFVPLYCIVLIGFSILIGAAGFWIAGKRMAWIISFLLLLVLSVDLLIGAPLIQRSYLGYDPLIGARYEGIGNELGGFFAAASILFLEPFIKHRRWLVFPFILCFLVLLGSSMLGENAGVTLASGCMFFVLLWWSGKNRHWKKGKLAISALGVLSGLLGLLWMIQQIGETSHIGHAFQQLADGEWAELEGVVTRKLQMNAKIVLHSNWTKLLLTSYVLVALYLLFEKNNTMTFSQQLVLKAGTLGSVFLLLLNDSGAVAASTSMFYLLCARYVWSFTN